MTETQQKDINQIIRVFRAYFISQLEKNLKYPIKCHFCETSLEREEGFFHFTTVDKWDLIRADLLEFLKNNPNKTKNVDLWNCFGEDLTCEPVIFVCGKCRPEANINLDFSTIFNKKAPKNFKVGALKTILKPENHMFQRKFFQKITKKFKKSNQIYQKDLWEVIESVTNLLINRDDISKIVTEWLSLIENTGSLHNSIIYPLSTIGLLIPKTDCKQFIKCLSKLSDPQIDETFHNMTKYTMLDNWFELIEHLNLNTQKIIFLKITQNNNKKILRKIFENFINYPNSFQNYIVTQLESIDDIILWEKLNEQILPKEYKKIEPKTLGKIHSISENYEKEKLEVIELVKIYLKHEKNKENDMKFFEEVNFPLTPNYRKVIEDHLKSYKNEFNSFFKYYPGDILGFDTESIDGKMICAMGIIIKPDLSFQITTRVIKDIYRINESSKKLRPKFANWVKKKRAKRVITQGLNWKEYRLARKSNSIYINSEIFLQNILDTQNNKGDILTGVGLRHFEKYINFIRKGCGIIKHRTKPDLFFNQFLVSLDRHLWEEPQRECNLCGKIQDVLLYCLEDAFISVLVFVWCVNRILIPEHLKKFYKKRNFIKR